MIDRLRRISTRSVASTREGNMSGQITIEPNETGDAGAIGGFADARLVLVDRAFLARQTDPHRERGLAMARAHPQVLALLGPRRITAAWIAGVGVIHMGFAVGLAHAPWWLWLGTAYAIGTVCNLALWALLHECTHDLVFRRRGSNRWAGIVAGLSLGLPVAATFRSSHLLHHRYPDHPIYDLDVPSAWEKRWVAHSSWRKALWMLFGAALQSLRTMRITDRPLYDRWFVANIAIQAAFDYALVFAFGWQALAYLVASTMFAVGLHPLGGRLIQEHFPFNAQRTASYYGPVNRLVFNAGYHHEHHDLMRVSWMNLPQIRQIAPEFYVGLASHSSWGRLLLKFIADPALGPDCRIARSVTQPRR